MSLQIQENQEQEVKAEEQNQPQSEILSEGQVDELLSDEKTEEVETEEVLPSDVSEDDELIVGKYKTQEDLINAYKELEKKLGNNEVSEATPTEEIKEDTTITPIPEDLFTTYAERYKDNKGSLSEDDYKELSEKGYDADFVDIYIEGVIAKNKAQATKLLDSINTTMTDYEQAVGWARDNWTEEQKLSFNDALASTNDAGSKYIIQGLMTEYNSKKVNTNAPIHTNTPTTTKSESYELKTDYFKDIQDPRYKKDAAYRAKIEAKMSKTDMSKWS